MQWEDYLHEGTVSPYYGFLFNLFAYPYKLFAKLPQIFFLIVYFYGAYCFILKSFKPGISFKAILFLFFNPLFWIFAIKYGSNDTLVAGALILGVILYNEQKHKVSISLLLLVSLIKFIPLFVLPFLCTKNGRIDWTYGLKISASFIIVFLLAYLLWSPDVINVLKPDDQNVSKMFSIFRSLRGNYGLGFSLDYFSIPVVLGSLIVYYYFHYKKHLDVLCSMVVSLLLVLTFYRIGHHQFYLSLLLLFTYWVHQQWEFIKEDKLLFIASHIFWAFIFVMSALYFLSEGYKGTLEGVREWMGYIAFILQIVFLYFLIKYNFRISRT